MQKLLERKKLQNDNNGAHFDFNETYEKVIEIKADRKLSQRDNLRTKTVLIKKQRYNNSMAQPDRNNGEISDASSAMRSRLDEINDQNRNKS